MPAGWVGGAHPTLFPTIFCEEPMFRSIEMIRTWCEDGLLLSGRLLLSLIFIHEAITLSTGFAAAAAAMGKAGVPAYALALTIALQLGAGLLLALGWHARLGALALALFCFMTAFLFHSDFTTRNELLHFEKDLAIAGGMLVLAVRGAGAWSLEQLWGRRMPSRLRV
jgi:putative oxidoreductase